MTAFGNRFPHLCENFLSAHNFAESVTLHMGRTGFPVGHFSKFKSEMVTVAHSLKNIPPGSELSANRMMCVSVSTYFSSSGRFINKLLFASSVALMKQTNGCQLSVF